MKRLVLVILVALLSLAAPVVVVAQEPPVYPPEGCVTQTGVPTTPLTKAGGGVLTFTFNSPQQPWTQAEEDSLRSWISSALPIMEEVYGPPATSATINIVKDSTISYAGLAGPDTIWLKVSSNWPFQLIRSEGVLVHEIGHAFRDGFTLTAPWEEGMVRALEVEVLRQLGWFRSGVGPHSYTYDIWHEALNEPDLGGNFFGATGLQLLRYEQAGYAWKKVLLEAENFFRDFNAKLYADSNVRNTMQRLIVLAASLVPVVEGEPFTVWYSRQHVFSLTAPQGLRIHNRIGSGAITVFDRYGIDEYSLGGIPVYWSVYDHQWSLIDSGTTTTTPYGVAHYQPDVGTYNGAGMVILQAEDADPDTAHRYFGPGPELDRGVFGIVRGLDSGTVEVICLDSSITASATVENGGFEIPELEPIRGRFQIKVTANDGRYWIRNFNKDASSYFVLVDGPVIRPTHVAEKLTLGPGSFYLANYPNPFNAETKIVFELPRASEVRLKVFTTTGQEMATVVNGFLNAGRHSYNWQAPANLASGVYFCHLKAGGLSDTKKMILLR